MNTTKCKTRFVVQLRQYRAWWHVSTHWKMEAALNAKHRHEAAGTFRDHETRKKLPLRVIIRKETVI